LLRRKDAAALRGGGAVFAPSCNRLLKYQRARRLRVLNTKNHNSAINKQGAH